MNDAVASGAHERVRERARAALGVGGDGPQRSLRELVRSSDAGWYPLVAIGALVLATELFGFAFVVLGPEISRSLGTSASVLATALSAKLLAVSVATLPMAAAVQRRPLRAAISVATAFVWTAVAVAAAFIVGPWGLAAILVIDGLATGSVRVLHQPLLLDTYPPEARVRVLAAYGGASALGSVVAPLVVAALTSWAGLTWRGVMLGVAAASLASALFALRLRDPGVGRHDTERVRSVVRDELGGDAEASPTEVPELRFAEVVRRLHAIPTIRRALVAQAIFGLLLVPYTTFLLFFLDERWGFDATARGVFYAASSVAALVALRIGSPWGERLFREAPARLVRWASWLLAASVLLIVPAALSPFVVPMVALFLLSAALTSLLGPSLGMIAFSIVPARFRPHLAALAGMYLAGVGGFAGALLLGSLDRRFGVTGAVVAVVVPGVVGALVLRSAAATVDDDLDRMIDEIVADEAAADVRRSGATVPLLSVRRLDVAYGQVQVLFGVDLEVHEGELLALLGTNGAGKSTVLRAISGLSLPTRGTVRLAGDDITWLDAERRVPLGIVQVPGGRSSFGPMSVIDNLRVHGHALGRNPRRLDAAVDDALATFPRLAERQEQPASTLSGGEQQMLALAKALVLRPRLLLIDELSLGLAPKVVGELLDIVRDIHARGTTVIVVEQSVNVALELCERAVFLERGRVQFEGASAELRARDDLLRSVFLGSATGSLGAS